MVLEVAASMFSRTGITGIWAERLTDFSSRQRIGSPFLAEIVAGNPSLAALYHSTSPAEDTVALETSCGEGNRGEGASGRPNTSSRRVWPPHGFHLITRCSALRSQAAGRVYIRGAEWPASGGSLGRRGERNSSELFRFVSEEDVPVERDLPLFPAVDRYCLNRGF